MNWFAPVDIYCERVDPSFWAEPINAVSNLAFIVAALWATMTAIKTNQRSAIIWLLVVLAYCIGVGSFLFHTFANTWSGLADTLPIWTFVAVYILAAATYLGGAAPSKVIAFAILAIGLVIVAQLTFSDGGAQGTSRAPSRFNGSEQYAPALIAMLFFSALAYVRRSPIRHWFLAATITFIISLTFRTFDMAICDQFPYGIHYVWHVLNGVVIALLLQALIRHSQRTPSP